MEAMMKLKESLFGKAKNNINSAQDRYKKDYNRKRKLCQVSFIPFSFIITYNRIPTLGIRNWVPCPSEKFEKR